MQTLPHAHVKVFNEFLNLTLEQIKGDIVLKQSELKTFEWDILNPNQSINLEINNKKRTSII